MRENEIKNSKLSEANGTHQQQQKDPRFRLWMAMEERFTQKPSPFGSFGDYVCELQRCLALNKDLDARDIEEIQICKHGHVIYGASGYTFSVHNDGFACDLPPRVVPPSKLEPE